MAIRTYDILLDSYNSTMPEPIVGRQGDKNGAVTLHVTITDRGTAVDLTGQTINLMAETAKGTAVVADNAGVTLIDATNGRFDYAVPNALWSESGKIKKAYFSLNDTDGQQTTYDLIFIVKKAIDISQDKADDYVTVIDGTLRDLKTKVDAIYATYQAGDFYSKTESDSQFAQFDADTATEPTIQLKNNTDELYPNTKWLGLTDMPRNTAYNYGQGLRTIAHRGNNAEWPENSLPAFRRTGRFWGIETDTTVTSDGTWVIMHDNTVNRMTNGTGAIKDMTYAQIADLRLDKGKNVAGCRDDELVVPRVYDYLGVCKEINKVPILEIKDTTTYTAANYDNLASVIRSLGWESQMWIISFGFTHLQEMRKRIPNLPVQWIVGSYSNAAVDKVAALGANVAIDTGGIKNVTDANVTYAHNKGVLFNVWTGDDGTSVENLANIGVDFLTKNGLSGDRKYTTLDLKNGWEQQHAHNSKIYTSSVAQIGSGYVHLSFNIRSGTTTAYTTIAQLPDWATPYGTIWANCIMRTTSGVAVGTFNINGRGNNSESGSLLIGLGWDQANTNPWVAAEITYYVGW